ncbi:MAG: tRNA (adenosine(37)-N6)-threonylcarbamoyltransferase complex dimerization subunit type 1 TsaB [Rhodospirillales bacterium]|nr:tRNA (adenosine(37)-N6)-threonylcarbamoyltransferase complex dimerization subunit type 1 TsaB [Rhodospirillales bacterium]
MKLLAIDTAAAACAVALVRGEELTVRAQSMARGHAEALVPMMKAAMAEAGLVFAALDAVAVSAGPGGFTGLRIGLAAARGLALATNRPCFGIPTLLALALASRAVNRRRRPVLAVLDSKRGDVYAQLFMADGTPRGDAQAMAVSHLATLLAGDTGDVMVIGDGVAEIAAVLRGAGVAAWPVELAADTLVRGVAAGAAQRWQAGERPTTPPSPVYLRPPATGPAARQR